MNAHGTQDPQGFYQLVIIINLDCVLYLEDKMGVECLRIVAFAVHTDCYGGQAEEEWISSVLSALSVEHGLYPFIAPRACLHEL